MLYSAERCRHCGDCIGACPEGALEEADGTLRTMDACQRCGNCVEACPADARHLAGRQIRLQDLLAQIERDLVFFEQSGGGVTLSGGEPLAQPRFTRALLTALRERGIHTAVETCGYAHAEVFTSIAPLVRLLLFDLKVVDNDKHKLYTGVENVPILANLARAASMNIPIRVRIPVVPGINDGAADARQFARCLSELRLLDVDLLPYHRTAEDKYHRLGWNYRLSGTPELRPEELERFAAVLTDAGLRVKTGG